MKNILICATQRCGSTMVIEDMRNTGVMGEPEEWFVPWSVTKSNINWQEAFEGVMRRASGPNGRRAIKVMANQLAPVEACLSTFMTSSLDGLFPVFAEAFKDWVFIKLTRQDVVSQAISRVMSRQTGVNHATGKAEDNHFAGNLKRGYDPDYNQKTVYDYESISEEVNAIILENLAWQRFFETNNIDATELFYEDICDDPEMRYLDVIAIKSSILETFPRGKRKLVKLSNDRNIEWRDAFFEEAAARNFKFDR